MKQLKVKITFIEDVLGSQPADPDVYTKWIISNAPDKATMQEEIEAIGAQEFEEKSMTVFPRTMDGKPCILDYQIKGFFKDSCSALQRMKGEDISKESCKVKAFKKVIDGCIFVFPRRIPIDFDGKIGNMQRPLRAQTAQGERICLANSETISKGSSFECTLTFPDQYEPVVKEWLNYGVFKGLGQWRNAGWGRFHYEVLGDKD